MGIRALETLVSILRCHRKEKVKKSLRIRAPPPRVKLDVVIAIVKPYS